MPSDGKSTRAAGSGSLDQAARMPPISHIMYVPMVLMIGFVFGFVFGGRAARDAEVARLRADEAKATRRAAREQARAAAAPSEPAPPK